MTRFTKERPIKLGPLTPVIDNWDEYPRGKPTFTKQARDACESHTPPFGRPLPRASTPMKMHPPRAGHDRPPASQLAMTYRVIDANANRATEGLRVVEEYLRFGCQDAFLCQTCKQLRHDLAAALRQVSPPARQACRATLSDVGTGLRTDSEYDRQTPYDLASANIRRTAEALRVLEEFLKLISPGLAQAAEGLRYRTYTLEKALHLQRRAQQALASVQLYVLVDLSWGVGAEFEGRIQCMLSSGVDAVQLRDKSRSDRELIAAARSLRRLTRDHGAVFFVNDRPDIAQLAQADGVHIGQDEMEVADLRSLVGPEMLIGVSTHDMDQAQQAVLAGADYLGVGPVFASSTKEFPRYAGLSFVQQASQQLGLPAFAIGGIDKENLPRVLAAGATRVAVRAAVWAADDPAQAARQLRQMIDESQARQDSTGEH